MQTTLNKIRAHSPCAYGWKKLLTYLGKTEADDEPLAITTILDSNGINDALWCLRAVEGKDREIRLYAVWCARQVQHLMKDQRSIDALDVAERYANGETTDKELDAVIEAVMEAARSTEWSAAEATAWFAVDVAAWKAARAAMEAARSARNAVIEAVMEAVMDAAVWDAVEDVEDAEDAAVKAARSARDAARSVAREDAEDAREKQETELRRICDEG